MDVNTCIKYLDFVSSECERYSRDRRVTDDELISLIVELERFKEKCRISDLPKDIKSRILDLKLNYTVKGVERSGWYTLAAFASFGSWSLLAHYKQQKKRARTLNEIRFDTSRLSSYVKLNY